MSPVIDWDVVREALPLFVRGWGVTLLLLSSALAAGFVLAVPLAVLRVSRYPLLALPVRAFTFVFRGTPLLVQLSLVYYGLAQFPAIRESVAWPLLRDAWFCAWASFTLNTTAYTTEIFAGALRATPAGELEAARAIGMDAVAQYRYVLLPAALRRALPQYGNEVVGVMHATAIVSAVSLVDLTRVARDVYATSLLPLEAFGTVAVFYFATTFGLVGLFRLAEQRWLGHLRATVTVAPAGAAHAH